MRIWMLVSEWTGKNSGGIARYAANFAWLLGQKDHQVTVITSDRKEGLSEAEPGVQLAGMEPHSEKLVKPMSRPAMLSFQMAQTVESLARSQPKPDLVEVQDYNALGYFLMLNRLLGRSSLADVPVLLHLHSPDFRLREINREDRFRLPFYWIGRMEKFCLLATDAILSPSQFLPNDLKEHLKMPLEPEVIPYPLDCEGIEAGPGPGIDATVLCPGRLEVRKGVLNLVEACHSLWSEGLEFTLKCIGGDTGYVPEKTMVGDFIKKRYGKWIECGRLLLAGEKTHKSILEEMRNSAVVVIPSLWENFPHTCMEAMSLGKVVVASENGGQAEMIAENGRHGFLFNWDKEGEFEQKLRAALNLSPQERLNMGQSARERILAFCHPPKIAEQRIEHMQKIIENFQLGNTMPTVYSRAENPPETFHESSTPLSPGLVTVAMEKTTPERHLERAMDCVRKSDYETVEILVIENGGAESWKQDIKKARGEYILFLEPGAQLEPSFLRKGVEALKRLPNVGFVYSWYFTGKERGSIKPAWNIDLPYFLVKNRIGPAVLARTAEVLNGLSRRQKMAGIQDLWPAMIETGAVGVSLPEPLARIDAPPPSSEEENEISGQPRLHREFGAELDKLRKANGPENTWTDPSLDSLWFKEKRRKEKRATRLPFSLWRGKK